MDNKKIGEFIKSLREERNLSQQKLADELYIDRTLVNKWENGKVTLTSQNLKLLSEFFNVSADEMLAGQKMNLENEEEVKNVAYRIYDKTLKLRKILFIFSIIIIILLISFLVYYFITFYNSVKVYTINSKSEYINIENSLLLKTNDKIYMRIELNSISADELSNVKIYYKLNNKIKEIYNSSNLDSVFINDYSEYQEYFDFNKFDEIINNLYIEYGFVSKNKYTEKLKIIKDYSNKNIFIKDEEGIYKKQLIKQNNLSTEIYDKLIKVNKNIKNNNFTIKYNNKKYTIDIFENNIIVNYFLNKNEYTLNYSYLSSEYLNKKSNNNDIYNYNINTDKCISGTCDNVKKDVILINNLLEKILK